jgi:hypothetical protein
MPNTPSKHGPVIPGIPVPSPEAIAELRELFAAGPYTGPVPEGARAVVAPKVTVTREYVCREFELGPARDGHVYVHREIGVRAVPDAQFPQGWCDSRVAECWNTKDMNTITLALNFAHQQGVI